MFLAATDCAHDFQLVARIKRRLRKNTTRHNLAVAFYGKTLALQAERSHQLAYCELGDVKIACVTVYGQLDQLDCYRMENYLNQYGTYFT